MFNYISYNYMYVYLFEVEFFQAYAMSLRCLTHLTKRKLLLPFPWKPAVPLCHNHSVTFDPKNWDYEHERKTYKLVAPKYYNFARDVIDFWANKEKV